MQARYGILRVLLEAGEGEIESVACCLLLLGPARSAVLSFAITD